MTAASGATAARRRLLVLVSRAVVRQWARTCGVETPHLARLGFLVGVAGMAGSVAVGVWVRGAVRGELDIGASRPLIDLLVMALALGAALLVVVIQSTSAEAGQATRALQPLPVPDGLLVLAVNTPVALALLALCVVVSPAVVLAVEGLTGLGLGRVAAAVAATVAMGTAAGLALVSAARWASRHGPPLFRGMAYPLAVLLLAAVGAGHAAAVRLAADGTGLADLPAPLGLLLGWPLAVRLLLEPGAALVAGVAAFILVVGGAGVALLAAGGLPVEEARAEVRRSWRAALRLPLVQLELRRLLRTRRVQAALAAGVVLAAGGLCFVALQDEGRRPDVAQSILFPVGISFVHLCLLARGLSPRHRPYPLVLGLEPNRWAGAVAAAAGLLVAAVWLPFAAGLAVLSRDPQILAIAAGLQLFFVAMASVLGASLVGGSENVGGELLSLFVLAAAATAVTQVVGRLFESSTPLAAAAVLGALGLGLFWVPGRIEAARWRADISPPT